MVRVLGASGHKSRVFRLDKVYASPAVELCGLSMKMKCSLCRFDGAKLQSRADINSGICLSSHAVYSDANVAILELKADSLDANCIY
jgi:hypothetical protein